MTDSGQAPKIPPDPQPPAVPDWAPTQAPGSAAPPAAPTPDPYAVEATMRLIPIQHVPPPATSAPPSPTTPTPPPAEPAPPVATERRIGKYIIKRELGRGGMGAVYLAEQPGLGREVAIKELILSAVADPTALKRFMQEAQVMARTSHPNLVQVHDLEQMGDANYIVLEFVRGKS
ncbi:MAG TPA: protein kinase, partial [Candidatus Dormibacteraeota bacterium]